MIITDLQHKKMHRRTLIRASVERSQQRSGSVISHINKIRCQEGSRQRLRSRDRMMMRLLEKRDRDNREGRAGQHGLDGRAGKEEKEINTGGGKVKVNS